MKARFLLRPDFVKLCGKPFRTAHEEVGRQVLAGTMKAPWSSRASLRKRDLSGAPHPRRVAARARAVRHEAATLRRLSGKHPPPLPSYRAVLCTSFTLDNPA